MLPTTLEQFNKKYADYISNPAFRQQLVRYVEKTWVGAVLNGDDLRVADIYGRPGGFNPNSRGGSVSLNVDIYSDTFFFMNDFDPSVNLRSANIIETLLLIYLGTQGKIKVPIDKLQNRQAVKMLLGQCCKSIDMILQQCVKDMSNPDSATNSTTFKKFTPANLHSNKFIARYSYYNSDGTFYDDVKHIIENGTKRYYGKGSNKAWPLYNLLALETLAGDAPVLLVEGERKVNLVHALVGASIFVTCVRGGSGEVLQPHHLDLLKGRTVYIMPDHDQPGQTFATNNLTILNRNNINAHIFDYTALCALFQKEENTLPLKYDVADFILENEHNQKHLIAFVQILSKFTNTTCDTKEIVTLPLYWASKKAGNLREAKNDMEIEDDAINETNYSHDDSSDDEEKDEAEFWAETEEGAHDDREINIAPESPQLNTVDDVAIADEHTLTLEILPYEYVSVKYCSSQATTAAALSQLCSEKDVLLGCDTETQKKRNVAYELSPSKIGLHPCASDLRLIQLYNPITNTVYVFDCNDGDTYRTVMQFITSRTSHSFVAHNASFELLHLTAAAMNLQLPLPKSFHCTHIQYRLLYDGKENLNKYMGELSSLASIVDSEFHIKLDKKYQTADAWVGPITEDKLKYAALDAVYPHKIYSIYAERLKCFRETLGLPPQRNRLIDEYLNNIDCLPALAQASVNGFAISPQYIDVATRMNNHMRTFREIVLKTFNIENTSKTNADLPTKPINDYLDKTLPEEIEKMCKRTPNTNEVSLKINNLLAIVDRLEAVSRKSDNYTKVIKVIKRLIRYRKKKYEMSTQGANYLAKNLINNKIHPTFKILGAKTGRMSCIKPNLQNISTTKFSRNYKNFYIPSPGYRFIEFDFSMIEVVFFAYLSNNSKMIAVLESGADIHEYTAAILTGVELDEYFRSKKPISKADRKKAKAATFGLLYGSKVKGFIEFAKNSYDIILSESEAIDIINKWKAAFYGVEQTHSNWRKFAYKTRMFETVSGLLKITPFSNLNLNINEFFNFGIQGSAATLIKLTIRYLLEKFEQQLNRQDIKIINFVHDSVLIEVKIDTQLQTFAEDVIMSCCSRALRMVLPQVPQSLARRCAEISVGDTADAPWGALLSYNDRLKKTNDKEKLTDEEFKIELEKLWARIAPNLPEQAPVVLDFNETTLYPTAPAATIIESKPYNLIFMDARVHLTSYDKPYLKLLFKIGGTELTGTCSLVVWQISKNGIVNPCRTFLTAAGRSMESVTIDDANLFESWAMELNKLKGEGITIQAHLKQEHNFLNVSSLLTTDGKVITQDVIFKSETTQCEEQYKIVDYLFATGELHTAVLLDVREDISVNLNYMWVVTFGIRRDNAGMVLIKHHLSQESGGWDDMSVSDFLFNCGYVEYQLQDLIGKEMLIELDRSVIPFTGKLNNNIQNVFPI